MNEQTIHVSSAEISRKYDLGNYENVTAGIWCEYSITTPDGGDLPVISQQVSTAVNSMMDMNVRVQARRARALEAGNVDLDSHMGLPDEPDITPFIRFKKVGVSYGRTMNPGNHGSAKGYFSFWMNVPDDATLHDFLPSLWEMARNNVLQQLVAQVNHRFPGLDPEEVFVGLDISAAEEAPVVTEEESLVPA